MSILITGATSGLGKELSIRLVQNNKPVILLARNIKKLEKLYDELEAINKDCAHIFPMNLLGAKVEDYQMLAKQIHNTFPALDGVFHCAAHLDGLTPMAHFPLERWFNTIHLHLHAPVILTQAITHLFFPGSKIVFFSDERAIGSAYYGAYGAAKAGLKSVASTFKNELENRGIEVYCYSPTPMNTPLTTKIFPDLDPTTLTSPAVEAEKLFKAIGWENLLTVSV